MRSFGMDLVVARAPLFRRLSSQLSRLFVACVLAQYFYNEETGESRWDMPGESTTALLLPRQKPLNVPLARLSIVDLLPALVSCHRDDSCYCQALFHFSDRQSVNQFSLLLHVQRRRTLSRRRSSRRPPRRRARSPAAPTSPSPAVHVSRLPPCDCVWRK